jgi:hypothetical protein
MEVLKSFKFVKIDKKSFMEIYVHLKFILADVKNYKTEIEKKTQLKIMLPKKVHFFVCKANELNKNAGRMNKSLICEIAIAHNYGEKREEFQEARNKTNFERYSLYSLGFFFVLANRNTKKIHTLKNNYGQKI